MRKLREKESTNLPCVLHLLCVTGHNYLIFSTRDLLGTVTVSNIYSRSPNILWRSYLQCLQQTFTFLGLSTRSNSQSENMQIMCEKTMWMQNCRIGPSGNPVELTIAEGLPNATQCHSGIGNFSSEEYQGSEGGSLPTTEPIFPPSYCGNKAKNYTCFIVSSFQGILWIWNFICLVSIHHILSVKFQLLSVSRLGKYAKIYPNAVTTALHAISGLTTGSRKNEEWEGLSTVKIILASGRLTNGSSGIGWKNSWHTDVAENNVTFYVP